MAACKAFLTALFSKFAATERSKIAAHRSMNNCKFHHKFRTLCTLRPKHRFTFKRVVKVKGKNPVMRIAASNKWQDHANDVNTIHLTETAAFLKEKMLLKPAQPKRYIAMPSKELRYNHTPQRTDGKWQLQCLGKDSSYNQQTMLKSPEESSMSSEVQWIQKPETYAI